MASRRKRDFLGEQMKFLLDMNLPPRWVQFLSDHGFKCVHWSNVGEYTAKDSVIIDYAREHGYTVFTHDLDFGACLPPPAGLAPV
jgi:predicted nuclease of predicted toxin-antitoxin system